MSLSRENRFTLFLELLLRNKFHSQDSNWPFRAVNSLMPKQRFGKVDFPQKSGHGQTPDHGHAPSGDLPSRLRSCIGT